MGVSPAAVPSVICPVPYLDLYRTLATAREIDRVELDLVRRGLAFFHVSGAGHEATACLARHLTPGDWLHVHYRDKALLLARGLPVEEFFASLLCRAGSHSEGRQMSAHFSAPHLHLLSQTGPVSNHALQAVGIAAAALAGNAKLPLPPGEGRGEGGEHIAEDGLPSPSSQTGDGLGRPSSGDADNAIVVCAAGDASTQQGEFLEAIRSRLPVLFIIEDNLLANVGAITRAKAMHSPDQSSSHRNMVPPRRNAQISGRWREDWKSRNTRSPFK